MLRRVSKLILITSAIAAASSCSSTSTSDDTTSVTETAASATGYLVETSTFSVRMPDEPSTEAFEETVLGQELQTEAWILEPASDALLQVLVTRFPGPVDEVSANGSFDMVIKGMSNRAVGRVTLNEPLDTNAGFGRQATIKLTDGGTIHTHLFAAGSEVVALLGGSSTMTPPAGYDEMVATFAFA